MRKSTARIWRRAALCVLLGLFTTITVAWLGAVFEKAYGVKAVSELVYFDNHAVRSYLTQGRLITRNIVRWDFTVRDAQANARSIDAKTQRNLAAAPYWSQAWRSEKPARPPGTWGNWRHDADLDEVAAGWPFRAFYAETDEPVQDPNTKLAVYSFRGGITLPTHVIKDGANIFLPRALPMAPIWPGLAADVIVFSLLWGLVVLPFAIVRTRRQSRGCCEACGYSLRGIRAESPCPECGASPTAA